MSERGTYGRTLVGTDIVVKRGSSIGTWLVGGLVVGGAILWARHQSGQIDKLYTAAGLPRESFGQDLLKQSKQLSSAASAKIHSLTQRFRTKKELGHGA